MKMSIQSTWIKKFCKEDGDSRQKYSSYLRCEYCSSCFQDRNRIDKFIRHLYKEHQITELSEHSKRFKLEQAFDICPKQYKGVCKKCQKSIKYSNGVYVLQNHLEIYHKDNSDIYKEIRNTKIGSELLDRYIIKGSEAKCSKCGLVIHLKPHTKTKLIALLGHWNGHFGKKIFMKNRTKKTEKNLRKQLQQEKRRQLQFRKILKNKATKKKVGFLIIKKLIQNNNEIPRLTRNDVDWRLAQYKAPRHKVEYKEIV